MASGRQYGNALLGVRHQEEEDTVYVIGMLYMIILYHSFIYLFS